MTSYGQWNGHPHTNKRARPTRSRSVDGVRAIRVSGATYRGCAPVDDVFELVGEPKESRGVLKVEVRCSWHGVKPRTCFPHLIIKPGHFEIIASYSGEVVDDISGPRNGSPIDMGPGVAAILGA